MVQKTLPLNFTSFSIDKFFIITHTTISAPAPTFPYKLHYRPPLYDLAVMLALGATHRYLLPIHCPWEGLRQRSRKVQAGPCPSGWVTHQKQVLAGATWHETLLLAADAVSPALVESVSWPAKCSAICKVVHRAITQFRLLYWQVNFLNLFLKFQIRLISPPFKNLLILLLLLHLIPTFMWGRCTMTYTSM